MRLMASSFIRFLDHKKRRTTVGRTPLDEWSARRRDLYLKTHNTHKRQTSMAPAGFEPIISKGTKPRLRPRAHWDRLHQFIWRLKIVQFCGSVVFIIRIIKIESTALYLPYKTQLHVATKFVFLSTNKYLYKVCRNIYDRGKRKFLIPLLIGHTLPPVKREFNICGSVHHAL